MSEICYVCLSDMHFGEEDSLLTYLKGEEDYHRTGVLPPQADPVDVSRPSPVLQKLIECLRSLIGKCGGPVKPVLILNGDILELDLTTTDKAAMAFERFIDLAFRPEDEALFQNEVRYVPGNHDHHLWEVARETQYVEYIRTLGRDEPLTPPWHVSNVFKEPVASYFLNRLVRERGELAKVSFLTSYPNLGFVTEDSGKGVIFTHGHYVESLYHLMSTLKTYIPPCPARPEKIWDIEAENFAWIEFIWSGMCRSGEFGQRTEAIYEKTLDRVGFRKLVEEVAINVARDKLGLRGWKRRVGRFVLKGSLRVLADRWMGTEKTITSEPLSPECREGLRTYVQGPLLKQIKQEGEDGLPPSMSFVFGHTHKPYEKREDFEGYTSQVDVYNTGGWIVETVKREPLHGGAIVLLDKDLNATSLRVYNETDEAKGCPAVVQDSGGESDNPLHDRVKAEVLSEQSRWDELAQAVARGVKIRSDFLRARIAST
ncbi:MAG: hypothetical protein ACYS9X_12580 [Planctomycetota bacterium]|jgi:hypothetical protein